MTLTLTATATAGLLAPLQQQPVSQHTALANKWLRPQEQEQQQPQPQQQHEHSEAQSRHSQHQRRHLVPVAEQPRPAVLTIPAAAAAAAAAPTRAVTLNNKYIVCLDKPCGRLLHGFKVANRPFVRRSALQIPRAAYATFLEGHGQALQRLHSRPHQAIVQMLDAVEPSTPATDGADAHDGYLIFQPLYGDLTRPIAGPATAPLTPTSAPGEGLTALLYGGGGCAQPNRGLVACAAAANAATRVRDNCTGDHAAQAAAFSPGSGASTTAATTTTPNPPSSTPLHDAATLKRLFRKMLAAVAHCHSLGVCVRHIEPASFAWTNESCTELRLTGLSHACVVAPPRWQAAPSQEAKALFAVDVVAVADVFRFLLRRRQQHQYGAYSATVGVGGGGGVAVAAARSPPAMAWMIELLKEMLVVPAAAAAAALANKQSVYQMQIQQVEDAVGGIVIPKTASELLAGQWLQNDFGDTVASSESSAAAVATAAVNGNTQRFADGAPSSASASAGAGAGAGVTKASGSALVPDEDDEHVVPVFTPPPVASTRLPGCTRTHAHALQRTSSRPAAYSNASFQSVTQNRKRSRARDETDASSSPFKIKV